jgi:hypothetical protein
MERDRCVGRGRVTREARSGETTALASPTLTLTVDELYVGITLDPA